jgi:lipopolysaccharide biosynthesis protein
MDQTYSTEDDRQHLRHLAEAFADRRYLTIDGRPVFLVYRPGRLPEPARTAETWRDEAHRLGLPDPYLCAVEAFQRERRPPDELGFDAAVAFAPNLDRLGPRINEHNRAIRGIRRVVRPSSPYRLHQVYDYGAAVAGHLSEPAPDYKRYPCVTPGWDNTARRRNGGGRVLLRATPDLYGQWLRGAVAAFEPYSPEENLFFVNAWNEWAEGNHLEPGEEWGHAHLDAHADLLAAEPRAVDGP